MKKLPIGALVAAALVLGALVAAAPATASDGFVLDPEATTPGRVIEDAAGNAYVTWTRPSNSAAPEVPMFCKVPQGGTCTNPIALPIPGATSKVDAVAGTFPVFGQGSVVHVVAPRFERNDLVVWTSTNGGESFDAGRLISAGYTEKTNPSSVLLQGNLFMISADNAGLGFSLGSETNAGGAGFSFAEPGPDVAGSSMALDQAGKPVVAYWHLSEPYSVSFYRYTGAAGSLALVNQANWSGPAFATNGYEPRLVGGAAGLFMVDEEYTGANPAQPTGLTLRRYDGTSFGPGRVLFDDPSAALFLGPAVAESPSGHLAVAFPDVSATGASSVMRLFTSNDGGASFAETDIAHLGSDYGGHDNAHLAIDDEGQGWVTFRDAAGLHLADLRPLPPPAPPAPPAQGGSPPPPVYAGRVKTRSKGVAGNRLILTAPASCLQSAQPFFVGVGQKAKRRVHRSLRGKLKILAVTFSFDGHRLATQKKKPFRLLVSPGPQAAASTHTVTARVVVRVTRHGRTTKAVRTLTNTVSIC